MNNRSFNYKNMINQKVEIKLWIISCAIGVLLGQALTSLIMLVSGTDNQLIFFTIDVFLSLILAWKFYPLIEKIAKGKGKVKIQHEVKIR